MKERLIETTDQYTLFCREDCENLRFDWKDKTQQLLSDFLNENLGMFCELAVAVLKIEAGELPSYGAFMDWYDFYVTSDGIVIGPGGEANYAGVKFEGRYSLNELKAIMDLYRKKYAEIYAMDIDEVDEDYQPVIEGIIEDFPAKEMLESLRRFPEVGKDP